jgi:hypothetical protein
MKHHLNIIVVLLFRKEEIQEATHMITHSTSKIESVHVRVVDVGKIAELFPKRSLASHPWRKDVGVLQGQPSKD